MIGKVRILVLALLAAGLAGCRGITIGGDPSPDVWAVNSTGDLMKFDLAFPSQIDSSIPITGLQVGEVIEAIDFRPSTNELFALGNTSRIYVINTATGVATQVGIQLEVLLSGGFFGLDFNPVADRLRVISDADLNMRVNPITGAVVDGDLGTPGVQPDTPINPSADVAAAAYTNSFAGATVTTLFAIDAGSDSLVRIGGVDGIPSPNAGALTVIGPLGISVGGAVGFDIDEDGNSILIHSLGGNANNVYAVNLSTGAATLIGEITLGGNIRAITIRN